MSTIIKLTALLGVLIMFNGCSSHSLKAYKDTKPTIDIKDFFSGDIKGWGIVQDRKGEVISRFDVTMKGSWNGDIGTLDEYFTYYNGKTQTRTWTITKHEDGSYTGTASDIIDKATGTQSGSAINWKYRIDLPVKDSTYRMSFDDWMWQMNDGVVINRSYIKKFGITFAELTLFMQKQ